MKTKPVMTILLVAFAVALLSIPATASASWVINFGDNGLIPDSTQHVDFSKVEFVIPSTSGNTGVVWSGTGITNFSAAGWSSVANGSTATVIATGPAVTGTLYWTASFTGTTQAPQNFELDYMVYGANSNTASFGIKLFLQNGQLNTTQNVGWQAFTSAELQAFNQKASNAVPVPPAVLLLGTGLVGVVGLRKRIHRG